MSIRSNGGIRRPFELHTVLFGLATLMLGWTVVQAVMTDQKDWSLPLLVVDVTVTAIVWVAAILVACTHLLAHRIERATTASRKKIMKVVVDVSRSKPSHMSIRHGIDDLERRLSQRN